MPLALCWDLEKLYSSSLERTKSKKHKITSLALILSSSTYHKKAKIQRREYNALSRLSGYFHFQLFGAILLKPNSPREAALCTGTPEMGWSTGSALGTYAVWEHIIKSL